MLARSSLAFTQSILGTKRECVQEKDELDEGRSLIKRHSLQFSYFKRRCKSKVKCPFHSIT